MLKSKRKNQAPIAEFWEEKLSLNYNAEIEYYRKLCGLKYNNKILRRDSKYNKESKYLSYQKWKRHILKSVNQMSITELKIYLRFLTQQQRNSTRQFTTYQTVMIPCIIFILSFISNMFNVLMANYDKVNYLISNILFYAMILYNFRGIITTEEDVTKNFYQDVKEIIDEKISQMEVNKA